jgi:hypothetical protein
MAFTSIELPDLSRRNVIGILWNSISLGLGFGLYLSFGFGFVLFGFGLRFCFGFGFGFGLGCSIQRIRDGCRVVRINIDGPVHDRTAHATPSTASAAMSSKLTAIIRGLHLRIGCAK